MTDHLRGTGRTTRSVARALIAAATGKRVVYVVHNLHMRSYVENLAYSLTPDVDTLTRMHVISREQWRNGCFMRALDITGVYFDHYQGD